MCVCVAVTYDSVGLRSQRRLEALPEIEWDSIMSGKSKKIPKREQDVIERRLENKAAKFGANVANRTLDLHRDHVQRLAQAQGGG